MNLIRLAVGCSLSLVGAVAAAKDPIDYVDPFIGTAGPTGNGANSGDVFPGVSVPFGTVKIGPDMTEQDPSTNPFAGYTPDGNVTAFTCFHECGIGGGSKYGVVGHMPLTTLEGVNVLDNGTYMQARVGHDRASVGYYSSQLENGVHVELSATQHAGFFQYSFPEDGDRIVLSDVSHYLPTNAEFTKTQTYSNGRMVVQNNGQRFVGWGVWRGGWGGGGVGNTGVGSDYKIYFCNDFDSTPSSFEYFTGPYNDPWSPPTPDTQVYLGGEFGVQGGSEGNNRGNRVGAYFQFPNDVGVIKSKMGVSFLSIDKACAFQEEISSWELNDTVDATRELWNNEVFSKVAINSEPDNVNDTRLTIFYTGLYHMHQMPSDRTGENPKWNSSEPYYDDFYTLWDTFRCLNSWYLLVQPQRALDMMRSLIDIWRFEGYMPDARSGNYNGKVQSGTNADVVLADAWVKGFRDGIDWNDAYEAMKTDAEVTPVTTLRDPQDTTCANKEGRCALPDWLEYNYITPNYSLSLSRTVDYAFNDFAISQVAKDLAPEDYQKYLTRSGYWRNIWNKDMTEYNITGFLGPRAANGDLITVSPQNNSYCMEGLPWYDYSIMFDSNTAFEDLANTRWRREYTWGVPHDLKGLIDFMGGAEEAEKRLDIMFVPDLRKTDLGTGIGSGTTLFNPGNEPSFLTPFIYNYFEGKQYKSVNQSRVNINGNYFTGDQGLPGNSDAGALDSWMLWQMMGLYPAVAQPVYLILSPWFEDISFPVGVDGKTLRITAEGLADDSFYVQSLKVNGKEWNKSWLSHDDIANGGHLEFKLGPEIQHWDTGEVPPSPANGYGGYPT